MNTASLSSTLRGALRLALVALALAFLPATLAGATHHENPCNPCAAKAANPCNPCADKAANPCNPCAPANPCNPCADEPANPCNPCAPKNPCNPCGGD